MVDRPLSISGRIVTAKDGKVETKLVNIDRIYLYSVTCNSYEQEILIRVMNLI